MDNNNLHIVNTHGNGRHSESSPDLTTSSVLDNNHNALNLNKTDESLSSSSSVEPRSESSLTDPIRSINNKDDGNYENFYDDVANDNIEADRESVLSDFISSHMVPLPQISAEPASDEDEDEEDFISVASSRDAGWEDNWLFKKKKSNKTSSSVGMLVPAPKEDIRALIGDKPTDEISDLSEVGSDTDDSSLEMVSASLEPLNDRLVNKHLIGGKNTKPVLDEIADRTSMISVSSLPDNVPPYTETKNEFVVSSDGLNESQSLKISVNNCNNAISNEAINSNVTKAPIATKVEKLTKEKAIEITDDESIVPPPNDFTDDEKMRNLLAKFNEEQNNKTDSGDDNSSSMSPRSSISCALSAGIDRAELDAYEGITDFSVEDEEGLASEIDTAMAESSSRRPSVIEILAAIALGPMLAVSASDDRNMLTEVELSSLMELNELAMAQLNAKAAEDRRLGVIVEESFDSHCDDHNVEIVDVNEEADLLSSPKMVMDAIKELVGKDVRRYSKSEESSVQIEEITEAEAEEFTEDSTQSKLYDKTVDSGQGSSENEYDLNEDNKNDEKEDTKNKHTTSETEPVVTGEILPSQSEDGTTKVEVHKNPEPSEDTFEIVSEEIVNKEETLSQCKEETIQPCEMKKELEPTDEPKSSAEPLDENQISIDEDNCNPMTSLSDDLGFEKIIPEDTSSISDESLHTIGSSPSECSDLEGDTITFYNDEKINSAPAELTDDQKLQQSKENDKNTNEFILPPPTAFCDEELKKLNEDGGNIESSQVTEAHINSEEVKAETQMTSANSTNEQEIKTNEEETHTENQCTDTKNTTEDMLNVPEVKEDKETKPEIEEVSTSKEVLPQSEKSEEPPDKQSLDENQSKPEYQSSSEKVSTPETIDNEPIQSSEIKAETQNKDSESKGVEGNTKLSTEETEKTEECKSTNLTEDQSDSTDLVDTQLSSEKSCEENSPAAIPIDEIKQNSASDGNSEEVSSQETPKPETNAEIEENSSTSEVLSTDEQLEHQSSSNLPINEASKVESNVESSNKEAFENLKENTAEVPENDTSSIKTEESSKQPEVEESNESSTIEDTQVLQEDTVKTELEENVQSENKSGEIQEVNIEDTEVTKVNEETPIDNISDNNVALTDDKTEVVSCSTDENIAKPEDEIVENSADNSKINEQPKSEDVSSIEPTNDVPSNLETSVKQNEGSSEESASDENPETKSNVEEPQEDQIKPIEEAQQNEGSSEESASTENPEQKSNVEDQTKPTEEPPIEESDPKTTVPEGEKQPSEDLPTETAPLAATEGCTQDIEINSAPNPSDAVDTETTPIEEKVESSNTDIVVAEDSVSVKTTEELSPETPAKAEHSEEKTTENPPATQISTSNEDVEIILETVEGKDLNVIQAKPEVYEPTLDSSEPSEPVQIEAEPSVVNPIPTEESNEDQEKIQSVAEEISKESKNDCELPPVAIPEPSPHLVESKKKIVESPETPETADVASIEPVFPTKFIDKTEEPIEGSSQAEAALENLATELLSETAEPVSTGIQKDEDPSEAPAEETEPAKGFSEINQEKKPIENETIQSNEDVVTFVSEEKTELKENEEVGATSSTEVTNESLGNNEIEAKKTNEASDNEVKSSDDVSTNEEQSQENSPISDKSISEAEENKCENKLSEAQKEDTLAEPINDNSNPQETIQTSEPTNEIKPECSSTERVSTECKEEENINQDSNKTTDEDVKEEIKIEEGSNDINLIEKEDCKTDDVKQVETEKSDPPEVDNATEDQTKVEEIPNIPNQENTSIEAPTVDQVTEPLNKEELLEENIESNVDSSSPVESNQDTRNSDESSKKIEDTNKISAEASITEEPVVIDEPKTESLGDTKSSASEEIAEAVLNSGTTDEEKLQKEDDVSKKETPEMEVEPTKVLEADETHEVTTEQVEKSIDEIGEDKSKNESEIKTETIDSKEEITEISTVNEAEVPNSDNVSVEKVTEPLNIVTEDVTKNEASPTVLEEPILDKQTEDINGNTESVVSAEADIQTEVGCQVIKEVLPDMKTENPQEQNTEAAEVEKTELGNVSTEVVVIESVTDITDANSNIEQQEKDDKESLSTQQANDQSTDGGTKTEEIEMTEEVSSVNAVTNVTDSDSSQMILETPQPKEPADKQEEVKSNEEVSESSKIEEITNEVQISDQELKEESIATITQDSSVQPETSEKVTESVLEVQPEVATVEVTEETNEAERTTNSESEEVKIEKESSTQENVSEEQKGSTPAAEDLDVPISKTEESIPPGDISEEQETQLTDAEEVQAKEEVPIDAEESKIEINPENQEQPAEKISEQESSTETQNAVQEVSKEHQETKVPEEAARDSQDQVLSTELPAQELKEELPADCEKVSEDASEPVLKTEDTQIEELSPPGVQEEVPNDDEVQNLSEANKTSAKESEQVQKSEETEIPKNFGEAEETEINEVTEQTAQDVSQEILNDAENIPEIEKIIEETKDSENVSEQNQKIEKADNKEVTELPVQVVEDEKASEVDNLPEAIKSSKEVSEEQQKLEVTEVSEIVPETEKLLDETNNSEGSEPVQKSENTKIDETQETPSVDSKEEQLLTVIPKQDQELTACADNATETLEEDVPIEKSIAADEISEVSKSEELKSTEELPSEQSSITEALTSESTLNNEEHKHNTENTKDAPIQSEEVQNEDKEVALESQTSIASEIVSNLQTDDEKIESITNVSESTLKTDDEKIEEMPVVESKNIEEPKVPEEITEDNIPVTTLNDQESVTDNKDVSADLIVAKEVIQKEDSSETETTISNNLESQKPEEADAEKTSKDSDSQKPAEATQDADTEETSTDEAISTDNDKTEKRSEETVPEKDISTSVQEISEETKPPEEATETTKTEEPSTESEIKQKTPEEGEPVEEEVTENVPVPTEVIQEESVEVKTATDVPIESQNTDVKEETVSEPTEEIQEETVEVKSATDETIESPNTDVILETVPEVKQKEAVEEKTATNEEAESPNTDTKPEIVAVQTEVLPEKEPNAEAVEDTPPEIVNASTSEETAAEVLQPKEESSVPQPEEIAKVTTDTVNNQLTESSAQQITEEAISCVEESQKADEIVLIEETSQIKPITTDEPLEQSEDAVEVRSESTKTEDNSETIQTVELQQEVQSSDLKDDKGTTEQTEETTPATADTEKSEPLGTTISEDVKASVKASLGEETLENQNLITEVRKDSVTDDIVELKEPSSEAAVVSKTNEVEPVKKATEEPLKTDIIEVKEPSSEAAEVRETNEQESVTEVKEKLVETDATEVVSEANEQELVTEVKEDSVKTDVVEAAADSGTNEQEVVTEVKEDSVKTDVVEAAAVSETNEQEPVAEVKEEPEKTDIVEIKESSPESAAVSAQEVVTEVKEEPVKSDITETAAVSEINEQELVTEATEEPVKTDIVEVKEPSSEAAAVSETNEQESDTEVKEEPVKTDLVEPAAVGETNEQELVAEVKEEPEKTDIVEVKEPSVEAAADSETNEPELVTEIKEEPEKTDTADVKEPSLEAAAVSETNEQEPVTEVKEETINTEIVEEKQPFLEVEAVSEGNEASKPDEPLEASTAEVTPSANINEPAISSVAKDVKVEVSNIEETPKAEESTDITPNESSSKEDSQVNSIKASEVETIQSDITNEPEQSQEKNSVQEDNQQKADSEVVQPSVAEADDDTDSEASFVSATEEELAETKNLIETAAIKELPEIKTQKSELVKEVWKSLETEKEELDESSIPQKLEDISIIQEKLTNIIDALQPEESLTTTVESNVAEEKPADKDTAEPKTEISDENKKDLSEKIEEEFADAIPEPVDELISPTSSEDSTGTAKEVHIQPTSNLKEDAKSSETIAESSPDEMVEQKEIPVKDDKLNSESETVLAKPANDEICSSSEAQPTEKIEVETKPSETIKEIDAAQTSTEVTEIVESKEIEAKVITKTPPNSLDCADAAIPDDKTTPPFAILNATCKIITHPPLEKTESLIQSAQYLYEKMSDPILETTPDINAPNLAEELRMATDGNEDTKELPPNSERVIPQSKPCESLCFTTDPQPSPIASDSIATTEQSNAQDASSAQGSIAEREYKKWYNAVDMPNNPYSVEALRRRLSTGGLDRVLDLPNISPCVEDKPLQLCENQSPDADIKGQERDYARYSRDYYINDAKHASGITKKSPTSPPEISSPTPTTASSIELRESVESTTVEVTTPVRELCHKLEKQSKVDADIYLATPVHVIEDIPEAFVEKNATIQSVGTTITSLTTEAVSKLSSDSSSVLTNASLTPSEDSDTIRIYDLKKQETRLVKETTHTTTITVAKSPDEKKVRPTELDITPTLAPPIATISSKSSTPTSFKFLQPKRKLINPSQVLSIDLDTTPITPCTPEKPVIEAEVAHAMPSVKALAKAFLMTSTTSTSENKWRKARAGAKSPLQFFKLTTQTAAAASTSKVTQKQLEPMVPDTTSQGSEDATIASDLSSLETDPPSRIDGDTEDENQERVVLSGCLRNNIAFFENLKNK